MSEPLGFFIKSKPRGLFYYDCPSASRLLKTTIAGSGTGADELVDADRAHERDNEGDEAEKAPGPAHVLLDYGKHDDGHEEDGGHLIPDTQLLGRKTEDAFHLLAIQDVQRDMIAIEADHETQFYSEPGGKRTHHDPHPGTEDEGEDGRGPGDAEP